MALTSSSPGHEFQSRLFSSHHTLINAPSSPTEAYQDGEISPTFDASFASSMSISSDPIVDATLSVLPSRPSVSPGPDSMMDCSPAPVPTPLPERRGAPPRLALPGREGSKLGIPRPQLDRALSQPGPAAAAPSHGYPFLKDLFSKPSTASISSASSRSTSPESFTSGPLSASTDASSISSASTSTGRRELGPRQSYTTLSSRPMDRLRPSSGTQGVPLWSTLSSDSTLVFEAQGSSGKENSGEEFRGTAPLQLNVSSRARAPIPAAWNSRHTAPVGSLLQPPVHPVKRLSEPSVPTFRTTGADSSPMQMDVDGSSPGTFLASPFSSRPQNHPRSVSDTRLPDHPHHSPESGADEHLADLFCSQDFSPIPNSRKRLLDLEHSPTPGSSNCAGLDSIVLGSIVPPRRPFEKATTTNSLGATNVARRRPSNNTLNRRPVLATVQTMGPPASGQVATEHKRHAQQLNGKPTTQKSVRRAYSVADAFASHINATGTDQSHRSSIPTDYFQSVGRMHGSGLSSSIDIGMADVSSLRPPETGSPVAGFREQETKGKALPCFRVKDDGLMRIDGATLNRLQSGDFSQSIKQFHVIDCRFSYEFEGGHINGALNLPTVADVEHALLESPNLPAPSTSEASPPDGKTVLIFHCEFSAKRAPTSAGHLRNVDRLKNTGDYPNVHYPEVYVLQGGYADYFKSFPSRCVGGYRSMDDPDHTVKRSADLNSFRHQQKRQFHRASSFTFGDGRAAAATLAAADSSATTFGASIGPRKSFERGNATLAPTNFFFPPQSKLNGGMVIAEEEHESGDSSFGTNPGSSPGLGDSPCPTSKAFGRHSLKIGKEFGRRQPMQRAQTSISMFHQ
ncbi:M-phase inducer tyrosine phosphatase, partial [Phenoliferia sp. Uapishka_3]